MNDRMPLGEYKLMGLAPYGEPEYVNLIYDNLLDVKEDGTFRLNMSYFNYATGLTMTNKRFHELFGGPPRQAEKSLTQRHMDIARSIQVVTEEIVLKICDTIYKELEVENLCLAGGVALNCVVNGRLLRESKFKNLWIQPAAGDAGGAVGAALSAWHEYLSNERHAKDPDGMQGSYLGPAFSLDEIKEYLRSVNASYRELADVALMKESAALLEQGCVLGWFQGRMEYGPRALGNRSILGDPRNKKMQSIMNLKIKYRESFRPFAPAVIAGKVSEWFELKAKSPYMQLVANVKSDKCLELENGQENLFGIDKLNIPRSQIPAVTHVDSSARVQTVEKQTNTRFYDLLEAFERETGCPVLVNTSFNVRGEPIVCTPEDAYRCFMRTDMDYLVMDNLLLDKRQQPDWHEDTSWETEIEPD